MPNIHDYTKTDFSALIDLWEKGDMNNRERNDDHRQIMRTITVGGRLILLKQENQIIGSAWLTTDSRRMALHHFTIHPKFRGMGYSHLLMNESMHFAAEKGLQIKLEVHQSNKAAINLYEKYGFYNFQDYRIMINRNPAAAVKKQIRNKL
ncbi:MAG: GNAT family N-acetyltransferase [Bacteroidota bacterium]|nr:GNAT family N-acetyltransferase [Bacteroidota bacterium]